MGETLRRQLGKQGAFVTNMAYPIIDSLEAGARVDSVPVLLEGLFGKGIQPYMISVMASDPAAELAKLDCPILIVNGTTDLQVTPEDGENLLRSNSRARMELIENMNHVLKNVSHNMTANVATYNKPSNAASPRSHTCSGQFYPGITFGNAAKLRDQKIHFRESGETS